MHKAGENGQKAGQEGEQPHREHASPRRTDEQDAPEPERPLNTQEREGESIQELDEPPQAEG